MTCENCLHYGVCTELEKNGISRVHPSQCGCFENRENWQKIRHAYWKRQPGKDPEAVCSNCGREVVYQIIDGKWEFENFCPRCGARMKENYDNDTINNFLDLVDSSKTVNAEPIKHGRWLEDGDYQICSNCGEEHCWDDYRAPYCESCGAKMDGKEE